MSSLFLIPARGGSKGLPGKNIKPLNGKPLIAYTIELAKKLAESDRICVSTDDDEIIEVVRSYGLEIPFTRPSELASDTASSYDVILHAVDHYIDRGVEFDNVVVLQPTSPLRTLEDVRNCLEILTGEIDAVVSVKEADSNPYFTLFEEDEDGFLHQSKKSASARRQDAPTVLEFNGAVYAINVAALGKHKAIAEFSRIKNYKMDKVHSVDIDDIVDFQYCEFLLSKGIVEL